MSPGKTVLVCFSILVVLLSITLMVGLKVMPSPKTNQADFSRSVCVVMPTFKRDPTSVKALIREYLEHDCVKEVFVAQFEGGNDLGSESDPNRRSWRTFQYENDLKCRFLPIDHCTSKFVLITDDDTKVYSQTIELLASMCVDHPSGLHGVDGRVMSGNRARNLHYRNYPTNIYKIGQRVDMVLTSCLMATCETAKATLDKMREPSVWSLPKKINGEDIVFCACNGNVRAWPYMDIYFFGTRLSYDVSTLGHASKAETHRALSSRPEHARERTQIARRCVQEGLPLISYRTKESDFGLREQVQNKTYFDLDLWNV